MPDTSAAETVLMLGVGPPDGVGSATALRFARLGYHVAVAGRTPASLDATVAAIGWAGGSAEAIRCDVTSEADLDEAFGQVAARGAPLAAVIYNAGNNAPIAFAELDLRPFKEGW